MSLAAAFRDLKFDFTPPDLPPLSESASQCVFTHPLATPGKAIAVFEIPSAGSKVFDYENDAVHEALPVSSYHALIQFIQAIGRLVASTSILKLIHTRYPLLLPAIAKASENL